MELVTGAKIAFDRHDFECLAEGYKSNSRFNDLDTFVFEVHSVKMPVGFGGIKTNGRQLDALTHLKKRIVKVRAESNCLSNALVIANAKITDDPNY